LDEVIFILLLEYYPIRNEERRRSRQQLFELFHSCAISLKEMKRIRIGAKAAISRFEERNSF
jgi:hypothetical protein